MLGHLSDTSPSEPGGRASGSTILTTLGGRDRRFQDPLGYRDKPMLSSQLPLGDGGGGGRCRALEEVHFLSGTSEVHATGPDEGHCSSHRY